MYRTYPKENGDSSKKLIKDLRGKKLEDGKPVGGRGWLTDVKVNQFQRYYGRAIRANIGNVEKMMLPKVQEVQRMQQTLKYLFHWL